MATNSAVSVRRGRSAAGPRRGWNRFGLGQQPFFEDKNRAFWILQSAGWAGYFFLRTLSGIANAQCRLWSYVVHTALLTAAGYSITLLMAAAYRRLIRMKPVYTWVGTIVIVGDRRRRLLGDRDLERRDLRRSRNSGPRGCSFLGAILLTVSLLIAWSALYYSINFFILLEEQSDRLLRLESQASNAQLAMLRYQLNPHFLFNTLNSISTLVLLKQTDRANAMLSRLSSFLRYTLVNESTGMVTLAQEIETLKLYLEIEKMRFEERLRPHFHIDANGDARASALAAAAAADRECDQICGDAAGGRRRHLGRGAAAGRPGADQRLRHRAGRRRPTSRSLSTGVGLANIRDRLAQAYGDNHRFETQSEITGGFRVFIDIPYQIEAEEPK